jgi:hypothetical protein
VDAFEKKELDLALVEGSLAHLRKPVSRREMAVSEARANGSKARLAGGVC